MYKYGSRHANEDDQRALSVIINWWISTRRHRFSTFYGCGRNIPVTLPGATRRTERSFLSFVKSISLSVDVNLGEKNQLVRRVRGQGWAAIKRFLKGKSEFVFCLGLSLSINDNKPGSHTSVGRRFPFRVSDRRPIKRDAGGRPVKDV